jgi:hypothetical protein
MTYPIFTDIADYVLDQLYGYQDANENIHNAIRLRDAFDVEHTWSNTDDTALGTHNLGTMAAGYLKTSTSTGAVSASNWGTRISITTEYSFNPTMKVSATSGHEMYIVSGYISNDYHPAYGVTALLGKDTSGGMSTSVYNTFITFAYDGGTSYYIWRYVTASPPHNLGEIENWGQFVYVHRKKSDGKLIQIATFDDAIWASGKIGLPKNHPYRIKFCPNPWPELVLAEDEEIILLDLRHLNVKEQFLREKFLYDKLVSEHQMFLDSGISEADVMKFENAQLEKVRKETLQISKAQNDNHNVADEKEKALRKLKKKDLSEDDMFLAAKITDDIFNRLQTKIDRRLKFMSKIDIIKEACDRNETSLAEEIMNGNLSEVNAEHELSDKHLLPQVEEFTKSVRVLCSSKNTDINDFKTKALLSVDRLKKNPVIPSEEPKPPKEEGKV